MGKGQRLRTGKRLEQIKASNMLPQQSRVPLEHFKRHILAYGFGTALLALAGLCVYDKCDNNHNTNHTGQVKTETLPSQPSQIDIIEDTSIQLPEAEFIDQQFVFSKPENLALSQEDFERISGSFALQVVDVAKNRFIPDLQQQENKNGAVMLKYIEKTAEFLQSFDPAILEHFKVSFPSASADSDSLVNYLNIYLNAGGYFMYVRLDQDKSIKMDILPLLDTTYMRAYDGENEVTAPVFHLGESVIPEKFRLSDRMIATVDRSFEKILFFETHVDPTFRFLVKKHFENVPPESLLSVLKQNLRNNSLYHELVHMFLAKVFPGIASVRNSSRVLEESINFNFNDTGFIRQGDTINMAELQELSAIGAHLHQAASGESIDHFMFLTPEVFDVATYHLFMQLYASAITDQVQDAQMEREIIDNLRKNLVPFGLLLAAYNKPSFTNQNRARVGEMLYRMGYQCFMAIQRGEIKLKSIPGKAAVGD